MSRVRRTGRRVLGSLLQVSIGLGFSVAIASPSARAAEPSWPADVAAHYKLYFNGFDVGSYNFESRFDGKGYAAQSSAQISALFGAFKWRGDITSAGTLAKAKPRPNAYELSYKSKKKQVKVALSFDAAGVKSVQLTPNKPPSAESVPLKPEHYKNVYDPMSAILAISHPAAGEPCRGKIPIFDGKARFDLVMSLKGREKISEKRPSGQPNEVVVCRVKYVPIAGHKPKDFVNPWIDYNGIEIALRPIPSAGIYVPYKIQIPTTIGAAVVSADKVTITSADRTEIALSQ